MATPAETKRRHSERSIKQSWVNVQAVYASWRFLRVSANKASLGGVDAEVRKRDQIAIPQRAGQPRQRPDYPASLFVYLVRHGFRWPNARREQWGISSTKAAGLASLVALPRFGQPLARGMTDEVIGEGVATVVRPRSRVLYLLPVSGNMSYVSEGI